MGSCASLQANRKPWHQKELQSIYDFTTEPTSMVSCLAHYTQLYGNEIQNIRFAACPPRKIFQRDEMNLIENHTPPKNFIPSPYAYHEEIALTIEDLSPLGHGVGRDQGWVIMVPFTVPGERIRARIFRNHSQHSEADCVEVIEASEERQEPGCEWFGECGGCQYQHMNYSAQLSWKRKQVEDIMQRIGGLDAPVKATIASPKAWAYRTKLTPHYPKPRDSSFPIGFMRAGRKSIVDIPKCPIASPAINDALPEKRRRLREELAGRKKRGGTLLLRDTQEGVVDDPNAVVSTSIAGLYFQFPAGEFFQNNPTILPHLLDYVRGEAAGDGIEFMVDAYCGTGTFAIAGSSAFREITGIEISQNSVRWAKANAAINQLENIRFLVGAAESLFEDLDYPPKRTAMVIDPPRKGCDKEFIQQLTTFAPARIVYVSCSPDTQARDLAHLKGAGYEVSHHQPFDLFPQTRHIENVTTLIHRSATHA